MRRLTTHLPLLVLLSACAGSERDKGESGAFGTTTATGPGLDDQNRFAFIADGVPVVTDTDGDPVVPIRLPTDDYTSLTYIYLNRTGTAVGFSLSLDTTTIRPFGVRIDPTARALDAQPINDAVTRSKGPVPDAAGDVWGWVQYGDGTSPSNLIRLTTLDGTSLPGDAVAGWTQVWGYDFLGDGRFVTIYSDNSTDGPLWALDPSTETSDQLTETTFYDHLEVGLDDRVLGTIPFGFGVFDPATGLTTEYPIFPWYESALCPTEGPSGDDPLCFFEMVHPDWSADGRKVVFMGRASLITYDDDDGDVFVHDVESGETVRLTDDDTRDWTPRLSADGMWVYWLRDGTQLVRKRADGTGDLEVIWSGASASGQLQVAWPGL